MYRVYKVDYRGAAAPKKHMDLKYVEYFGSAV